MVGDYRYRYVAARGLERQKPYWTFWQSVTGPEFEEMTADELEECARVMREALKDGKRTG